MSLDLWHRFNSCIITADCTFRSGDNLSVHPLTFWTSSCPMEVESISPYPAPGWGFMPTSVYQKWLHVTSRRDRTGLYGFRWDRATVLWGCPHHRGEAAPASSPSWGPREQQHRQPALGWVTLPAFRPQQLRWLSLPNSSKTTDVRAQCTWLKPLRFQVVRYRAVGDRKSNIPLNDHSTDLVAILLPLDLSVVTSVLMSLC